MKNHERAVRLFGLFFFFLILYAIICTRLVILQIWQSPFYAELGNQQYHLRITSKPQRGIIYDRHGIPLAVNVDSFALFITPKMLKNKTKTIAFLKNYYPSSLERLSKNSSTSFMYIKRKLTPDELEIIKKEQNEDLHILKEPARFYPHAETSQIVGFTSIDNDGAAGIELFFNDKLAGNATTYLLARDARSGLYHFDKNTVNQGDEPESLTLTIDSALQYLVSQELVKTIEQFHSTEGSVLILDPTNGEILAMVSYPFFNPNDIEETSIEASKPKPVTDAYELGSVIKIFPALAALSEKVVTPDEIIDCENTKLMHMDGVKFSTWKAHGLLPYEEVVALSNNVGTAKVTKRLGKNLYKHFLELGFNKKTGIELPGEQAGYINPPSSWTAQSPFSLSFGYEIRATLMQLAQAISVFANGGYIISPTLIKNKKSNQRRTWYDPHIINQVRVMMRKTITDGTAHRAIIKNVFTLGKTGTAMLLDETGHYDPDHSIYTFAGIVELGEYKRVIIIFIKESAQKNIYASSVSVPLIARVAHKMLIHDKQFTH
jgi:cell division protein FtsI (penicillin-binding protein 3)